MTDQFFLIDLGGQRWPVVHIPEKILDPEDKLAMPAVDYLFPVLAVERNYDIHWVTDSQVTPADTNDIFELAATAARLDDSLLLWACEQVVEHNTIEYWIQDFRSHRMAWRANAEYETASRHRISAGTTTQDSDLQLALKMQEVIYRASPPEKQAPAESSTAKRQRSPSSDPDDLYSTPSTSKRSRKEFNVSLRNSSDSSVTLRSDSQPNASEPSSKSTQSPSPEELRRLRLQQFTSKPSKEDQAEHACERKKSVMASIPSTQNASPAKKPRGLVDAPVDSSSLQRVRDGADGYDKERVVPKSEKWFPEHPGLEDQSDSDHSTGIWTTAQNAELIKLRERMFPRPSWQQIAEALHKKFPKQNMFKRMGEHQPRNHYNRMISEGTRTSNGNISTNGVQVRKQALAFLEEQSNDKSSDRSASEHHKYTEAEDRDIIRLREVDMSESTWAQITDAFNKKYCNDSQNKTLSQSALHSRYQKITAKAELPGDSSDDSDSEDEAEEAREDWMGKQPVKVSWTTAEDAELIRLRERMKPKPSWKDTAAALNQKFHRRGKNATPRNCNNCRERWRYIKADRNYSIEGLTLRRKALARLTDDTITLQKIGPIPFTTSEDVELVKLGKDEMLGRPWSQIEAVFNARLHSDPGDQKRSESVLRSRYQLVQTKWEEIRDGKSISMLQFAQSGQLTDKPDVWTSAQDDEIIRLKKEMPGKSWWDVAKAYNDHAKTKGWPIRTSRTIEQHFNRELRTVLNGGQFSRTASTLSDGGDSFRNWTMLEDTELLRLRKAMPHQSWSEVAQVYNRWLQTRGMNVRSLGGMQKQHLKLMADAKGGEQSNVIVVDDDEPVPQAPPPPRPFTADEDGELLFLREKFNGLARWDQIVKDFNHKFPKSLRSTNSLRSRYIHSLQDGAIRQIQGSVDQRERAIEALRAKGIELQVNDSISDSASERDENDDDEDEEGEGEEDSQEEEEEEDDTEVTILVGEGESATKFVIPLFRISSNRYFMDDEYEQPGGGHVISGFRWNSIKPQDFKPVCEFLTRGDFNPPLDPSKKGLQGITTDDQHRTVLLNCTQIFVLARKLLLWDLAALTICKVKLLKKDAVYLLIAAKMVFDQPSFEQPEDEEMRRLLVDEVERRYFDLMANQSGNMQMVLGKSPLFQVALGERLAQRGRENYDRMFG